jgi:hypothetical protein
MQQTAEVQKREPELPKREPQLPAPSSTLLAAEGSPLAKQEAKPYGLNPHTSAPLRLCSTIALSSDARGMRC